MKKPIINSLVAIDLTAAGPKEYYVTGNRLWLPTLALVPDSTSATGYSMFAQNQGCVIGVRLGDVTNEMVPMGCVDGQVNMLEGHFEKLIVRVIVPNLAGGHTLYLHSGSDMGIGYSNDSGSQPYVGLNKGQSAEGR